MTDSQNAVVDNEMEVDPGQSENADNASQAIMFRDQLTATIQQVQSLRMPKSLPPSVKRRLDALKKLRLEAAEIEAKFHEELHLLESKYYQAFKPLYEKRAEIVSGAYEPTDLECTSEFDKEGTGLVLNAEQNVEKTTEEAVSESGTSEIQDVKGIPDFWLTVFRSDFTLWYAIQKHDKPILRHLMDVKVKLMENNRMGFILEFHFSPNEYFNNAVLTKEYEMTWIPETDSFFSTNQSKGPWISKAKGCKIDWKPGKDVTIQTVRRKQKRRAGAAVRIVTKIVQNESFFNFFSLTADEDYWLNGLLYDDFEIGQFIRDKAVPNAFMYYINQKLEKEERKEAENMAVNDDDNDDIILDEEDEESEEDDENESDDEPLEILEDSE